MQMLKVLLKDCLKARGLSIRAAAREIGIAHTTLIRLVEGEDIDLRTVINICKWMGVMPASVLNSEEARLLKPEDKKGMDKDKLAAQIAAVLETEPKLAYAFKDAMTKVLSEKVDPDKFRDIAAYAAYRIGIAEKVPNATSVSEEVEFDNPFPD